MPYEPIRCPTCGSVKTIAAENKRFFCASCDGWFGWTDASHAKQSEPPQQETPKGLRAQVDSQRLSHPHQSEIITDWQTPAGYVIGIGILAFISTWLGAGSKATPFDGFLNPLFYIGLWLGWHWLEQGKETQRKHPQHKMQEQAQEEAHRRQKERERKEAERQREQEEALRRKQELERTKKSKAQQSEAMLPGQSQKEHRRPFLVATVLFGLFIVAMILWLSSEPSAPKTQEVPLAQAKPGKHEDPQKGKREDKDLEKEHEVQKPIPKDSREGFRPEVIRIGGFEFKPLAFWRSGEFLYAICNTRSESSQIWEAMRALSLNDGRDWAWDRYGAYGELFLPESGVLYRVVGDSDSNWWVPYGTVLNLKTTQWQSQRGNFVGER